MSDIRKEVRDLLAQGSGGSRETVAGLLAMVALLTLEVERLTAIVGESA